MREIDLNTKCNYIHLLSGGLDSAYSLLKIARKLKKDKESLIIHPIFFDYGHFSATTEWERTVKIVEYIRGFLSDKKLLDDPVKISLKSDLFQWCESDAFKGKGDGTCEIENRNIILFSVLASYLIACARHQKIDSAEFKITSGFKEKELPDCNNNFFKRITELLGTYTKNKFKFDFDILEGMGRQTVINKTKKLLRWKKIELRKFLQLTISCYSPINGKPCNLCCKCRLLKKEKMKKKS